MARIPTLLDAPARAQANRPIVSVDGGNTAEGMLAASKYRARGAAALAGGLDSVAVAFQKVQNREDQRQAKDQLTALSKRIREITYGDGTAANPGFYNMRGETALANRQATLDAIDKARQEGLSAATNKQVKLLYGDASQAMINPELDNIAKHSASEHVAAFKVSSDMAINEAVDRATATPGDDNIRAQSEFIIANETNQQLDAQGITDPKARAEAIKLAQSGMYKEIIKNAALNDVDQAEKLFLQNRDKIAGSAQADIEQDILVAKRVKQADEDHKLAMADRAQRKAQDHAFDVAAQKLVAGQLTYKDIMSDPNLDGRDRLALANGLEDRAKQDASFVSNDLKMYDLLKRINLPVGDPMRITDKYQILDEVGKPGGIDYTAFNQLNNELLKQNGENVDEQRKKFFDDADKMITQDSFFSQPDVRGRELAIEWRSHAVKRYDDGIAAGHTPEELTDPKSEFYVGKDLPQYIRTPQQIAADRAASLHGTGTPAPAAAPGTTQTPAAAGGNLPTVKTTDDYNKLPAGSDYIYFDKSGKKFIGTKKPISALPDNTSPVPMAPTGQ